ncbi:MAG: AraC family transcriptional regulator [Chitinophagales bacterium]
MADDLVILCYVGLSQAIFAVFLLFTKRPVLLPDRIMVFWLLIIALRFWLVANGIRHKPFFDINFSDALIPLTFGPFLYLYSKYLISEDTKMAAKDYVHFIPFIFLTVYFLVIKNIDNRISDLDYGISLNLLFLISILVYSSLVFIQLRKYRQKIRFQFFSYDTSSNRLFWLNYVAIISVVTFVLYFFYMLISIPDEASNYNLQFISSLGLVIFSFSVSYFGVNQRALNISYSKGNYYGIRNMLSDLVDKVFRISKIGRSDLVIAKNIKNSPVEAKASEIEDEEIPEAKKRQIDHLIEHMESDRPYMNPMLTLQDLAEQTNIPKHQLTILFNSHMGLNFFEFVNQYRLDEVKKRLLNPKYAHYTIMAIAYDCGFNSKSTFNTLFKEVTGKTPTQWRKDSNDENEKKKSEENDQLDENEKLMPKQ